MPTMAGMRVAYIQNHITAVQRTRAMTGPRRGLACMDEDSLKLEPVLWGTSGEEWEMSLTEIFWVIVALATIAPVFYVNRQLYGAAGVGTSGLEAVYYVIGLAALFCGWYFN